MIECRKTNMLLSLSCFTTKYFYKYRHSRPVCVRYLVKHGHQLSQSIQRGHHVWSVTIHHTQKTVKQTRHEGAQGQMRLYVNRVYLQDSGRLHHISQWIRYVVMQTWASFQIRKIAGYAWAGNAGNVFPANAGLQTRHESRQVRDARAVMHTGIATYRFPLKSVMGKTFPAFPVHAQPAILRIW